MSDTQMAITAELAWLDLEGVERLVERPFVVIERASGTITSITMQPPADLLVHDLGHALLVPGLVNAHSHAFQRMIRGRTHRRTSGDPSSFWSWREAMYEAANALDPAGIHAQTKACFAEMLARGITCVGEFHYLHHDPEGRPYDDANELSEQVVAAAQEVGIRLVLLDVYYARAGVDQAGPLPEQRRFCDGSVDAYLRRIDDMRTRHPDLRIGITPHSVRAVRAAELGLLAAYADEHELVVHSHVSEQPLENQQCHAEHGRTPTQVFADAGCLARPRSFTAVHAIHVSEADRELLAHQSVCACPSTEADLGDGIVPARELLAAGASLALGSDSNAIIDLVQEARLLEMHERLRTQSRLVLHDDEGRVATTLLGAATRGGARALGWPELGKLAVGSPFDAAVFDLDHRSLAGVPASLALDALLLTGTAEPLAQVWVAGQRRM